MKLKSHEIEKRQHHGRQAVTIPHQPRTAADTLDEAADTYRERNKVYKDNFVRLGNAMHAIFPEGLMVSTPEDWTRLYFLLLTEVKTSRYATNWQAGGHKDSVHDQIVYAAMLETFDEQIARNNRAVGASGAAKAQRKGALQKSANNATNPTKR